MLVARADGTSVSIPSSLRAILSFLERMPSYLIFFGYFEIVKLVGIYSRTGVLIFSPQCDPFKSLKGMAGPTLMHRYEPDS